MSLLYIIMFGIITLLFAIFIYLYRNPTKHTHVQLNVLEPSKVEKEETLELENIEEQENVKKEIEEKEEKEDYVESNKTLIPRKIWTYWDSESLPPIIEKCIGQWKKHCPNYTITILSPSNIKEYIHEDVLSLPMATTPQRTSDFVRLHVLEEHGGIWADASLLLTTSLDWIHKFNTDVVVYSIDHIITEQKYPVLENWFIACIPHCDFIEKWKTEFMTINKFTSPELYIKDVESRGTDLSSIFCTPYLSMHVAAQYVLQKQGTVSTMTVLDAREGPYKHLRFNSKPLSFEEGIPNLCKDDIQPVIKFRGIDRTYMKDYPESCKCIEERVFNDYSSNNISAIAE